MILHALILLHLVSIKHFILNFLFIHLNLIVLKLLASAENSEFTKEMEKDIAELVQTIDPEIKKTQYDPINACESLEILHNFALLEKTIVPILKHGAITSISHLLKHELKEEDAVLAEKGLLSLNERLMTGALGNISQLVSSAQALKTSVFDDILKNNVADLLIETLKIRGNNANITEKVLDVANALLNNDKTKEELLSKLVKANITDQLTDLLEKYNEEPAITQYANNLLFNLTKASPEVAAKLAKQNFVKNLMKETKNHLKEAGNDEESLRLTKQNLQCLTVLAEIGQTAEKLALEGGIEFATGILKKENQLNPLLPDEDQYYQLNLASTEQDTEKKLAAVQAKGGSLDDIEEKSISYYATDLLDQMVKDPKKANKLLNEDVVKEILQTIQINAYDKPLVMKALDILNKASENEKLVKIIEANNGANAIFTVLNQHATDAEVTSLAGEVLNSLGIDQLLEKTKGQIGKLCSNIKPNNEQALEELNKADVYLANLLTMPPPEDESKVIESNKNVIKAIEKQLPVSLENPELLASNLLLVSRLANQGELTKEALRNSSIPKIILKDVIPNADIMKPEHGKISELALGSIESMVGGGGEFIKMLDPKKGKEVQAMSNDERKNNIGNNISELLKANNGDLLEEILSLAELKGSNNDKPLSLKTIERAAGFMARLCENDPSLAAALLNKGGVSKLRNLFEDMSKQNNKSNVRESPMKKVGKLMGALSKSPEGFQALVKETDLVQKLLEDLNTVKINQDMDKDPESIKTLTECLNTLEEIIDNDYDKSDLIEYQVPECVINVVRRLNQLPVNLIKENEAIGKCLQAALKTLEKLAKDPALGRILAKTDGPVVMADSLHKADELSKGDLGLRDPGNKPNQTDEIIGSQDTSERIIENTLSAFAELTTNPKNAEKLELLNKNSSLANDLKEIMVNKANNPVIVATGLKILENCLKASNKEQLKSSSGELKELESFSHQMLVQYPKLPFIGNVAKNIAIITKNRDPELLILEEKAVQKQELRKMTEVIMMEAKKQTEEQAKVAALEIKPMELKASEVLQVEEIKPIEEPIERKVITVANSSDLITKLDLVADCLDEFLKKTNKPSQLEEKDMGKLVVAIGNFSGAASGKVAQLHNMGVTDGLIGIIESPSTSEELKNEGLEALAKLTKDAKLVEKMSENDKLAETIAKGLFENGKKKLNNLQKGIVKSELEAAGNLSTNETTLQQFRDAGGIKAIIEMMKNNKETPDILTKCSEALTRLAVNDDVIKEIIELGGLELVQELYEKYPNLLELLRAFAGLVAKLATNEVAKNKLGEGHVISIIVDGVKLFNEDLILGINSCLALGNLAYAHAKNSELIIKTEFIAHTHNYTKKMMKEAELMANVCSFFNSLGFKNSPNKKEMGKKGVMDDLQKIFDAYTSQRDLKLDTLKQCFK